MFTRDITTCKFVKQCVSQAQFPLLPITSEKTLYNCRNLNHDGYTRIYVTSYPKSGTTWMQNIVYTLVTRGKRELDHISYYAPFYEADRSWSSNGKIADPANTKQAGIGFRIFNTHLLPSMIPRSDTKTKIIYVVRNPKDVVCSFFHHLSAQHPDDGGFEGSFENFYSQWIEGNIAFGKWTSHVEQWLEYCNSEHSNVLVVSFEAMKANLTGEMCRVAKHLGLSLSEEYIVKHCVRSFLLENMKRNKKKSLQTGTQMYIQIHERARSLFFSQDCSFQGRIQIHS